MDFGLRYLQSTLGIKPKISWQIDSFGHSVSTPDVLTENGFKYVVLNRVGLKRKNQLRRQRSLEFHWKSDRRNWSSSNRSENTIIAHVLYDHYNFPEGFNEKDAIAREATVSHKTTRRQNNKSTHTCTEADAYRLLRIISTRMRVKKRTTRVDIKLL